VSFIGDDGYAVPGGSWCLGFQWEPLGAYSHASLMTAAIGSVPASCSSMWSATCGSICAATVRCGTTSLKHAAVRRCLRPGFGDGGGQRAQGLRRLRGEVEHAAREPGAPGQDDVEAGVPGEQSGQLLPGLAGYLVLGQERVQQGDMSRHTLRGRRVVPLTVVPDGGFGLGYWDDDGGWALGLRGHPPIVCVPTPDRLRIPSSCAGRAGGRRWRKSASGTRLPRARIG
jgi:hypothetical protein